MEHLNEQQWVAKLQEAEDAIIIDVRTPQEWQQGIISGAKLLDIYEPERFMETLHGLDKTKSYFMYCRSGARSGQACQVMNQIGIEKAYNLAGGIMSWSGDIVSPE